MITGRFHVPWWYRFIHSWRARMWIETGIWVAEREAITRPRAALARRRSR